MPTRLVRFQEGMKVGFGYDLLNGVGISPAVKGTVSSISQAQGQQVISSFLRIDDLKTLHETLGVNVDAGASYFSAKNSPTVQNCNTQQDMQHRSKQFDRPMRWCA